MLKARDVTATFGMCGSKNASAADISKGMNYLGVTLLRASMENQADLDRMLAIQAAVKGFRLQWLFVGYMNDSVTIDQQFDIGMKAKAAGLNVESVEGPNEENNPDTGEGTHGPRDRTNYGGNDGARNIIRQWAEEISRWQQANWPGLTRIAGSVIAYSLDQDLADVTSLQNVVDKANVHVYPQPGKQPSNLDESGDQGDPMQGGPGDQFHMIKWMAKAMLGDQNAPIVLSETGSPGSETGQPGRTVDFGTQAITCQNCFMDALSQGVHRCIFYYLQDGGVDQQNNQGPEAHYGWFNSDGSPKPVATQFKRLLAWFADAKTDFVPAPLQVTVAGLGNRRGASGCGFPVAMSDGGYLIPVWDEPRIWDNNAPVNPGTVKASVGWGSSFGFTAYDGVSGNTVAQGTGASVDLAMSGHPVYIRLAGKGAPPVVTVPTTPTTPTTPATPPKPASVMLTLTAPIQAGSYTLVPATAPSSNKLQPLAILLSEDAYQGDALATVTLDGVQVVKSLPVVQLRSKQGRQAVALGSVDATKSHQIVVTFENDAFGGDAASDRNLYVEAYTLGTVTTTLNLAMLSGGPLSITIAPA